MSLFWLGIELVDPVVPVAVFVSPEVGSEDLFEAGDGVYVGPDCAVKDVGDCVGGQMRGGCGLAGRIGSEAARAVAVEGFAKA